MSVGTLALYWHWDTPGTGTKGLPAAHQVSARARISLPECSEGRSQTPVRCGRGCRQAVVDRTARTASTVAMAVPPVAM